MKEPGREDVSIRENERQESEVRVHADQEGGQEGDVETVRADMGCRCAERARYGGWTKKDDQRNESGGREERASEERAPAKVIPRQGVVAQGGPA